MMHPSLSGRESQPLNGRMLAQVKTAREAELVTPSIPSGLATSNELMGVRK